MLTELMSPNTYLLRKNENPMHYWLSFSPAAPMFGVKWRFASARDEKSAQNAMASATATLDSANAAAARATQNVKEATEAAAQMALKSNEIAAKAATEAAETASEAFGAAAEGAATAADAAVDLFDETAEVLTKPTKLFATPPTETDDLTLIKGVGPKLAEQLNDLGIYKFGQISRLTQANIAWLDANLNMVRGRTALEDWVAQSKNMMN